MSRATSAPAPAPSESGSDVTITEIEGAGEVSPSSDLPGIDIEALLGDGDATGWRVDDLIGAKSPDLIPHEADRDFALDASDEGADPFAKYLGRNLETDDDPDPDPIPVTPATPEPATKPEPTAEELADPGAVELAKSLGLSVEELLGAASEPEATPTPVADPTAAPASPEVAALQEQVAALQGQLANLTQVQAEAREAETLAQAEARQAQERQQYEADRRAAHEERYAYLEDADREEVVQGLLDADLAKWDGQLAAKNAEALAQAQARETATQAREATYERVSAELIQANPTLGLEIKPGYRFADFLADTHRAAGDAYGLQEIGDFKDYAGAFQDGMKVIQTKAFQAGIAYAQQRAAKGAGAPPVLSNKGGGGAPPASKTGPTGKALLDINTIDFFGQQGKPSRR